LFAVEGDAHDQSMVAANNSTPFCRNGGLKSAGAGFAGLVRTNDGSGS
jgi:hypothetical protein